LSKRAVTDAGQVEHFCQGFSVVQTRGAQDDFIQAELRIFIIGKFHSLHACLLGRMGAGVRTLLDWQGGNGSLNATTYLPLPGGR
jgi:hypothetical protein